MEKLFLIIMFSFLDHEIGNYENFTRASSTERENQRKHRENQSQQDFTLLGVKCDWGMGHFIAKRKIYISYPISLLKLRISY